MATAQLPSLYHGWIESLLGGPIPAETAATCSQCAMADAPDGRRAQNSSHSPPSAVHFDVRVKCCSYVPPLPNFLVGRILLDSDPQMAAGRASVRARLAVRRDATPLGLQTPAAYAVLYDKAGVEAFGKSLQLLCPHFQAETGGCGIWRHRQSVCTTWYCKADRGEVGARFWKALLDVLRVVERALAVHCVRTLATGPAALRHAAATRFEDAPPLGAADLDATAGAAGRDDLWGPYAHREPAFYEASAGVVNAMTWADVLRVGGVELELVCDLLRAAYRDLKSRALPTALRTGSLHMTAVGDDRVEVTTYSGYDPLSVPKALFDVLHVFDGRPVARALAAAAAAGVELDRAVVRRLVDFGVLVDAASQPD